MSKDPSGGSDPFRVALVKELSDHLMAHIRAHADTGLSVLLVVGDPQDPAILCINGTGSPADQLRTAGAAVETIAAVLRNPYESTAGKN